MIDAVVQGKVTDMACKLPLRQVRHDIDVIAVLQKAFAKRLRMSIGLKTPLKLEGNCLLLHQDGGAGGETSYGQEQIRFEVDGYLVSRVKAYLLEAGQKTKGPSEALNGLRRKIGIAANAIQAAIIATYSC